jgi:hypothetical protein
MREVVKVAGCVSLDSWSDFGVVVCSSLISCHLTITATPFLVMSLQSAQFVFVDVAGKMHAKTTLPARDFVFSGI